MMNHQNINISVYQMNMFLVVCECGSFTLASHILNTTQSAISKSIASLEVTLGFPLFFRKNKKLVITPAGKLLEKSWSSIVQNIECSIDSAYALYRKEQRSIVVGEPDSMKSDKDFWPKIELFKENHKDVNLLFSECSINELVSKLEMDEFDVIFTIDYEVPVLEKLCLNWCPVADSPLMHVVMHQNHPLATRESITLSDLTEEDFIVADPATHQSYIDFIYALCQPYGFHPKTSIIVPNTRSMISTLVRTQRGVILGNRFLYDGDRSDLKHFTLDNTYSRLIVAWKDYDQKPIIQDFIKAVTVGYQSSGDQASNTNS